MDHSDAAPASAFMTTASGVRFDLMSPAFSDVHIEDVAHALSNLCRFTGSTSVFYSVAQHSVLVSDHVPPADALWGLLHDASEAYINDLSRPLKHHPALALYCEIEAGLMSAVCERFTLPYTMPASVKRIDNLIVITEAKQLLVPAPEWTHGVDCLDIDIKPLSPREAEEQFLNRYVQLTRWEQCA